MLLLILFLNLVICDCVKNKLWNNSDLLKFFKPNLSVVSSLLLIAVFNLLNCKLDSLNHFILNHFISTQ